MKRISYVGFGTGLEIRVIMQYAVLTDIFVSNVCLLLVFGWMKPGYQLCDTCCSRICCCFCGCQCNCCCFNWHLCCILVEQEQPQQQQFTYHVRQMEKLGQPKTSRKEKTLTKHHGRHTAPSCSSQTLTSTTK